MVRAALRAWALRAAGLFSPASGVPAARTRKAWSDCQPVSPGPATGAVAQYPARTAHAAANAVVFP